MEPQELAIWLAGLFGLGVATLLVILSFVKACEKV